MRSQDTTDLRPVCFPFWMAQEMALDLAEKSRLQAGEGLAELQLATYKAMVAGLEQTGEQRRFQLELLQKNNHLLEHRLKLEKSTRKRVGGLSWLLQLLGSFALGYLVGGF